MSLHIVGYTASKWIPRLGAGENRPRVPRHLAVGSLVSSNSDAGRAIKVGLGAGMRRSAQAVGVESHKSDRKMQSSTWMPWEGIGDFMGVSQGAESKNEPEPDRWINGHASLTWAHPPKPLPSHRT